MNKRCVNELEPPWGIESGNFMEKESLKGHPRDLKVETWKLSMLVNQHASILCSLFLGKQE